MAIGKEKILENGAEGDYWRITSVFIDRQHLHATGRIALFKDKATSDAGKPPLGNEKSFRFSFAPSELVLAPNIIAFVYTKIRAQAETLIYTDILGNPLPEPVPFDPDLAFGDLV